jgi:PRTRC genetic system protein B
MYLEAEYGETAQLDLVHAILLYGSPERIRLATVHTPESDPNGGPPILGEGQPLTRQFLETLCRELGSELPTAYLPEQVLIYSTSLVAWWEPAQRRAMFFSHESDGKTFDGKVFPHPPLVFAVRQHQLHVWALDTNSRPTPESRLFLAPYWNVNQDSGAVCHGSMAAPRTVEPGTLAQWSDAFFTSRFTHSNLGIPLCKHPEGFLGMWRNLAGQSRFPAEYLIPKGTLRETLCRNHRSIA